jgi:hypothetical protein
MPPTGFETAIPASEQLQTHTLDHAATGTNLYLTNTLGHCMPQFQFIMKARPHILIQSTAGNTGFYSPYFKQVIGMEYFASQLSVTSQQTCCLWHICSVQLV